ncbi:hypothetical protein [Streptomyces violaceusniger]|uniref:hypothetical protein n=1 Tax=Streptomyces violaceusniger TaxID=68280 RepID=UPI00123709E7|nr:hypothetical protein [Streptomyces violaceusniger]
MPETWPNPGQGYAVLGGDPLVHKRDAVADPGGAAGQVAFGTAAPRYPAHRTAGDIDALRTAAAHLAHINEQLGGGVDMEAETAELLRNLLPRTIAPAR